MRPASPTSRWPRNCAVRSPASVTRSRRRSSWPPSRRCSRAVTWSGRRRPGPGRRPPSRFPSSSGSSLRAGGTEPLALVLVPDARARGAGRRGDAQLRARHGRAGAAGLRRRADRPAAGGARARRRRRGGDAGAGARPHQPGHAEAERPGDRRPRRSGRDARHGLRRRHRGDPRQHPREPADRAVLGDDAAADRRHGPPPPAQPGAGRTRPPGVIGVSRRPAGAADRLRRAARAQGRRARPRARPGDADGHGRLLPHQGRGGPAHRVPERPRLSGRGAARRNGPAAARPGHGPAAQPEPSTFWWPPTWPPAASTSTSSRTW